MNDYPIYILCGEAGSGKSEIVLKLGEIFSKDMPVSIVDLDNVKIMRTIRHVRVEKKLDLPFEVISIPEEFINIDIPIVAYKIRSVIEEKSNFLIVDVGGNSDGAIVLGSLNDVLVKRNTVPIFVLNPFRPFSNSFEAVRETINSIQRSSKLVFKNLIINLYLGEGSTLEEMVFGERLANEIAKKLELDVLFRFVQEDFIKYFKDYIPISPLLFYPWEEGRI
ncbi:hypothetical protein Thena_0342 [Thermodesulfobium narugense DSM 14796]|uniref:CobQ/CobB/MinD/ParA nucleotide binding domain-containing protein n=1 Tax=Thermodesulfobium narugense DSM 14796 TaxID=747365 RepID=M1E644_9BACT|nr:hypothetical protein [Thermodesulfobium narugense]AEE13988.1 hypothetical protein Thena_0342 [Thermodesulfobium narugense DSM 14796]